MWKVFIAWILLALNGYHSADGLKCYLDTIGNLPLADNEPLKLDNFKVFDCNTMGANPDKVLLLIKHTK
jgi:hypothetical protein